MGNEQAKKSIMNLPKMLSVLRMLLVPFFVLSVLCMDMGTLNALVL